MFPTSAQSSIPNFGTSCKSYTNLLVQLEINAMLIPFFEVCGDSQDEDRAIPQGIRDHRPRPCWILDRGG